MIAASAPLAVRIVSPILALGISAFCLWAIVEVVRSWRDGRKNTDTDTKLGLSDLTDIHRKPVTYVKVASKGELGLHEMDIEKGMSAPGSYAARIRGLAHETAVDPDGVEVINKVTNDFTDAEGTPLTDPGTASEDFNEILGKIAAGGELTEEELNQLKDLQDARVEGRRVEGRVEKENYPYGKAYAKQ